jgi:hypothetical protein
MLGASILHERRRGPRGIMHGPHAVPIMRRLLSFVFLLFIAVGVWLAARWLSHRGELHATIVLPAAGPLRTRDPVVSGGVEIGSVSAIAHLDGSDAVSIRIRRDHRRDVLGDSLFDIEGEAPHARLVVNNTIAVGAPIEEGEILRPRHDRLTRWLAAHGSAVAPLLSGLRQKADRAIDRYQDGSFDRQLGDWKKKAPEWKSEGRAALDRNLAAARSRVEGLETDLRKRGRADEAEKLKKKFDAWWADVKK